jgi:pantetheine-phosphate adenylyltransferase
VIVAVGHNPAKKYTFDFDTRVKMVHDFTMGLHSQPEFRDRVIHGVMRHDQYLVDYAREAKAQYLIRGIRGVADFEYEYAMRQINADLAPEITTVFLTPPRSLGEVSSSMVKGMVGPNGWEAAVQSMVPENVMAKLKELKS